ncbi:hypothetical protein CHUAL_006909 [Chamberlinius hualienensis]
MLIGLSRVLWIFTPVTSTMALLLFTVAIFTNQWLHSEEKIKVELNASSINQPEEKDILLPKFTVSGLWTLCYTEPGQSEMHCINIDYFPVKEYSPDPADSTMAIPYAVTRAAIFYFISIVLLLFGEISCIFGHCFNCRRIFIFISGCTFITTGLTILAGLVIYISTFKSEVGAKLQEQSSFQPPLFTYTYGFSFLLVVACFLASELSGTSAIFLYIRLCRKHWSIDILKYGHQCQTNAPTTSSYSRSSGSRFFDYYLSRENSPRPSMVRSLIGFHTLPNTRGGGTTTALFDENQLANVHGFGCPAYRSESMRELSYYSLPLTSRDITCNTLSTTVDINRDYSTSRDFSYDTLRRTTPV